MAASNCGTFSLESVSPAEGAGPTETIRSAGFIISMPIYYANRQSSSNLDDIRYKYIPATLARSEMKLTEVIHNSDGSITYLDRHGIRIMFGQTGVIGTFDFLALVLNLVGTYNLTQLL